MLKGIGIICMIAASAGMGYKKGADLTRELSELQEIRRIFLMLRSEVEYAKSPMDDAFYQIGERLSGYYKRWLCFLAENLKNRKGQSFQEIWEISIQSCLLESHLSRKNLGFLNTMGANLGHYDRTMQIGAIDLYLEQLKMSIQKMQEEVPEKRRILNCLGVMGGIFVAVVLM